MEEESIEMQQSTAHRMIFYFYERMAIGRDAWDVGFWTLFQLQNPDIGMDAKTLRTYFFDKVMTDAESFAGLPYEVLVYINPLFNKIRAEVLEYRDLVEGIDYVFDRDEVSTAAGAAGSAALPPIQIKATGGHGAPATKRCANSTTEHIHRYVSDGLSELVWTEEEKTTKPVLSVTECLQRVALLTQNGISLVNCIEPGMSCYDRFRRMGLVEPADGDSAPSEESMQFQTPQGISTPLYTDMLAGVTSTARQDSALGQSITEREKLSGQAFGSYRTASGNVTPNYGLLRHVRSKKRQFRI